MPLYEFVYIARQDLTPTEVDGLTDKFNQILVDNGGKIVSKEYWGLRNLAYKISKNSKGHYVLMYLDAPYAAVAELQRIMSYNENIIRRSVFKINTIPTENSELMVSVDGKSYKKDK